MDIPNTLWDLTHQNHETQRACHYRWSKSNLAKGVWREKNALSHWKIFILQKKNMRVEKNAVCRRVSKWTKFDTWKGWIESCSILKQTSATDKSHPFKLMDEQRWKQMFDFCSFFSPKSNPMSFWNEAARQKHVKNHGC